MASSSTLSHDSDYDDDDFNSKLQGPRVLTKSRGIVSNIRANWENNTAHENDARLPCNEEADGDSTCDSKSRKPRALLYGKGKSAKEKRKLREKRRSTGVVNLSQESTGEELDDDKPDEETVKNTAGNKTTRLEAADSPSSYERRVKASSPKDWDCAENGVGRCKPLSKISALSGVRGRDVYNADRAQTDPGSNADPVKPLAGQKTTALLSRYENSSSRPIISDWRSRLRSSSSSGKESTELNAEVEKLKKELASERAQRIALERQLQDQSQRLAESQLTVEELSEEVKTLNQELDDMDEDNLKLLQTNRALMEKLGLSTS